MLAAAAVVVLVAATGDQAYARVTGPRVDSLSAGCGILQDRADALRSEYKNATNKRREAILQELRVIAGNWHDSGCQAVFGSITRVGTRQPELTTPLPGAADKAPDPPRTPPAGPASKSQ